eukprot:scaffold346_cov387-Prasinococcus_capsulatus_cf.AAC.12
MKAPKQIGEIGKALNGFHEPHELRLWSEEVRLRLDWHVYEYLARKMPASDMPQFLNRKRMEGPDVNLKLKLEDPEKDFTEIYLAQLLEHPERASQYAEVLENLGHAVEEHTILEVKWLLERDLKKYRDGGVRYQLRRFKSNFKLEEGDEVRRGIFDLELALVNLTLPCLSRNKKMQVDFVKSLLLQLQRISELMSRTQSVSDGANDNVGTPMKPEDQPLSEKDEKSILAVALWLRLHLLLPLLPIVYSTRPERCAGGSGDARMQSMREQLIRTCLRLTACPIVQEGVSLDKDLEDAQRLGGSVEDSSEMVGADAERSASASGMCKLSMGEGLFNVIVAILHALLGKPLPRFAFNLRRCAAVSDSSHWPEYCAFVQTLNGLHGSKGIESACNLRTLCQKKRAYNENCGKRASHIICGLVSGYVRPCCCRRATVVLRSPCIFTPILHTDS